MTKAKKRLPKEVFCVWNEQDDGESYLIAGDSITEHATKDAKVRVGTYKLMREDDVILVSKISQRKARP